MALQATTEAKLKKQVEFYFSDSNAPRDKFLLGKIHAHPEGYVELATICSFSRMVTLLNLPPNQKPEEIPNAKIRMVADALADSDVVRVNRHRDMVRRRKPLENELETMRQVDERTVYFQPLPFDCTLDGLTQFFNAIAPVRCVRMRRHPTSKDFRGSVFVEFETKESAEKVVAEKEVIYEGAAQQKEMKRDFIARKYKPALDGATDNAEAAAPETETLPKALEAEKLPSPPEGSGSQQKRKRDEADAANLSADPRSPTKAKTEELPPAPKTPVLFIPGVAFQFTLPGEVAADEQIHFSDIRNALAANKLGVCHVVYTKGDAVGSVKVSSPSVAQELESKKGEDGKLELELANAKVPVEFRLLEGNEEREYHEQQDAKRKEIKPKAPGGGRFHTDRRNNSAGRGNRGRFGGRGRFGRRGRVI